MPNYQYDELKKKINSPGNWLMCKVYSLELLCNIVCIVYLLNVIFCNMRINELNRIEKRIPFSKQYQST